MRGLVLSLFPGIDLLGRAFEAEGWCVVWGPDVIYARDIRGWHVPAGRFDGVIAGVPCKMFSSLAALVRANGNEPKFGNLFPEVERVIAEAEPRWWLTECSPKSPTPAVAGYDVEVLRLCPWRDLGGHQSRDRKFCFGTLANDDRNLPVSLSSRIPRTVLRSPERWPTVTSHAIDVQGARGRTRDHLAQSCERQGFPELDLTHIGWRVDAACEAVGNGVPRVMGKAFARAIAELVGRAS